MIERKSRKDRILLHQLATKNKTDSQTAERSPEILLKTKEARTLLGQVSSPGQVSSTDTRGHVQDTVETCPNFVFYYFEYWTRLDSFDMQWTRHWKFFPKKKKRRKKKKNLADSYFML